MRDLVLAILAGGIAFFTLMVVLVAFLLPQNQGVYALFAGILGNFSGGLMVYLHLDRPGPPSGPPGAPAA